MTKDDEDVGEKLQAPPDFDGPTSNRSHTDILCNLLLWCMWISMTGLGIYAVQNGEFANENNNVDFCIGVLCALHTHTILYSHISYLYLHHSKKLNKQNAQKVTID